MGSWPDDAAGAEAAGAAGSCCWRRLTILPEGPDHRPDLRGQRGQAGAGRADQGRDPVYQAELAGELGVHEQVDSPDAERGGGAERHRLAGASGQLIAGPAAQAQRGTRGRRGDELPAGQGRPEAPVRGGLQRHPGPELGRVDADDADRTVAGLDLRAVEGDHVPDSSDLVQRGQLLAGQPGRRHDQQIREDDLPERGGVPGRGRGRRGAARAGRAGLPQPGVRPDAEQHERAAARDAPERERARAGGGGG